MKRTRSPDELAAHWVLTDTERQLLPDRVDHNRLGFAVHLKFFELEGRFPESPREMRRHPAPLRYTFLAAFGWHRRRDIIDGLVDLLVLVIHRIGMRAERKVVQELLRDLQRVSLSALCSYQPTPLVQPSLPPYAPVDPGGAHLPLQQCRSPACD